MKRIYNLTPPSKGSPTLGAMFAFRNELDASKPLEILVYEIIGKDPWTGEGFDAKAFADKLSGIDPNREILMRVNSRGGSVFEGLPIYNRMLDWKGKKVGIVDGVAASIATILLMAMDEVQVRPATQMIIHDAWVGGLDGNAADLREVADRLDATSNMLAVIYAKKTKRDQSEIRQLMQKTTLMTGSEAKDMGFADTIIEGAAIYNFSPEDITEIKGMCRAASKQPVANHHNTRTIMDRNNLIALLKAQGLTVDDKATDEQLLAMLNSLVETRKTQPAKPEDKVEITELKNALKEITESRNRERKDRIERAIDKVILEDRIPADQRAFWTSQAMTNESVLEQLAAMPQKPPGPSPLPPSLECKSEDINTILNHFDKLPTARAKGVFYMRNSARMMEFMNAAGDNTIAAGLKRQVIMQEMVRAFASAILPLSAFSTVFNGVKVEGTDIVNVPYYDLETAASSNWAAATGYVAGETTTDTRAVTINKRKYQTMGYTSSELRRQPFLSIMQQMKMKAEKLGVDVFKDVLSIVTLANYGAAVATTGAEAFDSDDVADVRGACNSSEWPEVGRSLILDTDYDTALTKDGTIKAANEFGSDVAQSGLIRRIMGFDYFHTNNLPDNSEHLVGIASHKSAILVATAPIQPAEALRNTTYSQVIDGATGIAMEFRTIGVDQMDSVIESAECNYGYTYGNKSALKRIVSA